MLIAPHSHVFYYVGTTSSIQSRPPPAIFISSGLWRRYSWDVTVKRSRMFVIDLTSRLQNSTRKASKTSELNWMHVFQLNLPCSTLIFRLLHIDVSMTAWLMQIVIVILQNDLSEGLQETFQRTSMLYEGIKAYVRFSAGELNCLLIIRSNN
jgi:hypothetical protein